MHLPVADRAMQWYCQVSYCASGISQACDVRTLLGAEVIFHPSPSVCTIHPTIRIQIACWHAVPVSSSIAKPSNPSKQASRKRMCVRVQRQEDRRGGISKL